MVRVGTARAHDEPRAFVRDILRFEAAVANRLIHRNVIPGGPSAVKAHRAAIEDLLGHEGGRPLNPAAEAHFRVFFGARDPRSPGMQAGEHFLRIVADRRDDPHPGDDDAPHSALPW
jgi:hypothetical protein